MMKKLSRMLLVTALIMCLQPVHAYALTGIDLSRVKFSSSEEKLYFKFGELRAEGVVRQKFPFTEAEINKIAQETLSSMGLTQLDIVEMGRTVQKARRAAEFTPEDMERIKQNLLTTMGAVPAADKVTSVLEVVNNYMSTSSWDDIGTVSADLLSKSMSDKVKDSAKGYIKNEFGEMGADFIKKAEWKDKLLNIVKFCGMLADEHARTKQKWKDIADGANAKRKLNEFYDKLQDNIDVYKEKSNEKGWLIDFNDAMTYRVFTFFGVDGNIQEWYLTMKMDQETTNEYGSVAGTYSGLYIMTAEHDMSAFTSGIANAAPNIPSIKEMVGALSQGSIKPAFRKKSDGSAYISRTITGTCTAVIEESGEIGLTLNEEKDETHVTFSNISVDLVIETGTVVDKYADIFLPIDIGNKEEKILVKIESAHVNAYFPVASSNAYSAGGWDYSDLDESIWKHWDGTEKTLSFEW